MSTLRVALNPDPLSDRQRGYCCQNCCQAVSSVSCAPLRRPVSARPLPEDPACECVQLSKLVVYSLCRLVVCRFREDRKHPVLHVEDDGGVTIGMRSGEVLKKKRQLERLSSDPNVAVRTEPNTSLTPVTVADGPPSAQMATAGPQRLVPRLAPMPSGRERRLFGCLDRPEAVSPPLDHVIFAKDFARTPFSGGGYP